MAIFTRVLLHEDARTLPSMAEVGGHVTTYCVVIGPFQILDPEVTYLGHDECLQSQASAF